MEKSWIIIVEKEWSPCTEELMFYADKIMVMGNSKNLCVFYFAILLNSRKFDAREIYVLQYCSCSVARSHNRFCHAFTV